MTPDRQQLVQDSWRAVEPNAASFVALVVRHLLDIAPAARAIIDPSRLPETCDAIARTLETLVGSLDEPKRFVPATIALGRGNADRGMDARLYESIGESLLWALHEHLGEAFTPDVRAAWTEGYHLASAIVQRAEKSRTGEFERFRTGEFAAFQNALATEVRGTTPST